MVLTAHNSILGWISGFNFNHNNVLSGQAPITSSPFPIIIADPSFMQCWKNWNLADTGMVLTSVAFSIAVAFPIAAKSVPSLIQRKVIFYNLMGLSWIFGGLLGIRNSSYRLQGLVPNGLQPQISSERIKYDFTSEFLQKSFWGHIFQSPKYVQSMQQPQE